MHAYHQDRGIWLGTYQKVLYVPLPVWTAAISRLIKWSTFDLIVPTTTSMSSSAGIMLVKMSLKYLTAMSPIAFESFCNYPKLSCNPVISFCFALLDAWAWNNLVLRSPSANHWVLARCFQRIASRSNISSSPRLKSNSLFFTSAEKGSCCSFYNSSVSLRTSARILG